MMEAPYHYQFRVIVIGDTMVGKSSLLKTFSEGSFGEVEPTVGVDFFSKIIKIHPKHHNSNNFKFHQSHHHRYQDSHTSGQIDDSIIVKLQIWDTAGQERFKSIVTSYYRNSVGIVLVYDVTNKESYNHLINWFEEARRHVEPSPSPTLSLITQSPPTGCPNNQFPMTSTPNATLNRKLNMKQNQTSPHNLEAGHVTNNAGNVRVDSSSISLDPFFQNHAQRRSEGYQMAYLVIGCKTDLESQRQVSYGDGKAFAEMHDFKFIETSSKLHHNVNQAFQMLAEEIYDKISECGKLRKLHRTPSGGHLTLDGSTQMNEGVRLGPLLENISRRTLERSRVRLLEAQPVSGFLGGCC